ncbi:hypothetical protein M132_4558 [Bacteroides fragilis str. S24L15]|nr:hypothetical protein M132_4558 [Bacteroides fragilis str. S24L15]
MITRFTMNKRTLSTSSIFSTIPATMRKGFYSTFRKVPAVYPNF